MNAARKLHQISIIFINVLNYNRIPSITQILSFVARIRDRCRSSKKIVRFRLNLPDEIRQNIKYMSARFITELLLHFPGSHSITTIGSIQKVDVILVIVSDDTGDQCRGCFMNIEDDFPLVQIVFQN